MRNIHKIAKFDNAAELANTMHPKGVHHTVSFAESFNDTWTHIKNEIRKSYKQS